MEHMRDIKLIDCCGELSVRALNGLLNEGCLTLEDVARLPENLIKRGIPNIGRLTAEEIIDFKKLMSSLCYLRVEDRKREGIAVSDNMGGEIMISDYEQVAQLCYELLTLRDLRWGGVNDDAEPDDSEEVEKGSVDILVDPEDGFVRLEQGLNSISIMSKQHAQSIAESLLMLVRETDGEE